MTASTLSVLTSLAIGISGLTSLNETQLFYLLVVVFIQRDQEVPCVDDVTPPPPGRRQVQLACLAVCLLCLLPFPVAETAQSAGAQFTGNLPPGFDFSGL